MDWIEGKARAWDLLKKYRYAALVLLLGIFLMTLPQQEEPRPEPVQQTGEEEASDLEDSLEQILSQLQGAGRVSVLLTQARGEQTIYQTDGRESPQEEHRDTVLVTNAQREETGLIRQVIPPVYQGAIVVCQGADNASVRLSIVEAVMSVTGLTSDHITVLKMK